MENQERIGATQEQAAAKVALLRDELAARADGQQGRPVAEIYEELRWWRWAASRNQSGTSHIWSPYEDHEEPHPPGWRLDVFWGFGDDPKNPGGGTWYEDREQAEAEFLLRAGSAAEGAIEREDGTLYLDLTPYGASVHSSMTLRSTDGSNGKSSRTIEIGVSNPDLKVSGGRGGLIL